jgi:two-component system, response regulator YesN
MLEGNNTLIIVDDFFVERESAREIIEQSDLPIEIVGEFENGRQAVAFLREHTVDMVLADIEMPIVNGLEMQRQLNDEGIEIDIIFFSLYNRFEYVQQALRLGAFGYVIKPIDPVELLEVFSRLLERKQQLKTEQQRLDKLRGQLEYAKPILAQQFLMELFLLQDFDMKAIREQLDFHQLDLYPEDKYAVTVMEVDGYHKRTVEYSFADKELFKMQIEHSIQETFLPLGFQFVRIEQGLWAFLATSRMLNEHKAASLYEIFEGFIQQMQTQEISISCSISNFTEGLNSLSGSFALAREALQYKFSLGFGQVIDATEFDHQSTSHNLDFQDMQQQVSRIVQSGSSAEVRRYVHRVMDTGSQSKSRTAIKKISFSLINALQLALSELNLSVDDVFGPATVLQERLQPFETIGRVADEIIHIMHTACEFISSNADNNSLVVRRVRQFIEEHYHNKITVQEIADAVFYSPNYLNTLFRKETSSTLLEYLTKVRVEKAKQLLLEPNAKIYKVSEAVGYSQESYFRTVFKRQAGMSPKEYMKKIGR